MARLVAVCADEPAIDVGSDFVTCTSVVWEEDSSAWAVPDLTQAQWGQLVSALLLFFVTIAVIGLVRKYFT
jgi:hypothetical protein